MGVGGEYLEIALKLRRLVPDWVEAYVGPPALASAVDALEDVSAEELHESVQDLAERVAQNDEPPDRRRWLSAQLQAIETALLWRTGHRFSYQELFERCHGAHVEFVPDKQFEEAHALLERGLPGHGDVAARYRAWRDTQLVPREQLQAGLDSLAEELRRRCQDMFGLPDAEQVTWELVSDEPWAGSADYLGQYQTLIRINTDRPISSARLLELVCHEAYPGHHAEHVCKDGTLMQEAGREELAVYVYPTPQGLISEGLASYALQAMLGEDAERIAAGCLRPIGVPYDHETAAVVRAAEELLLPVRSNIALMLDDGWTAAQACDYARTWLLDEPQQIDEAITNLVARSWRPYESCYPVGLVLCRRYAAAAPERFRDLLYLQLTPSDLAVTLH
jgi:hypothetical protein